MEKSLKYYQRIVELSSWRCCTNKQNGIFREMLGYIRYQPVYKVKYRPNIKTEEKIQWVLQKIKRTFSALEYSTIYPKGLRPGKFYGIAKVHKLPQNGNVDQSPIRPIVSNIGTATYQLAEYLAKLLSPLNQSQHTVKSTRFHRKNMKCKCSPWIWYDITRHEILIYKCTSGRNN